MPLFLDWMHRCQENDGSFYDQSFADLNSINSSINGSVNDVSLHSQGIRVFFYETELLKLSHYRIRQTIAQSTPLDEKASGKPTENSLKIFRLRYFHKTVFRL